MAGEGRMNKIKSLFSGALLKKFVRKKRTEEEIVSDEEGILSAEEEIISVAEEKAEHRSSAMEVFQSVFGQRKLSFLEKNLKYSNPLLGKRGIFFVRDGGVVAVYNGNRILSPAEGAVPSQALLLSSNMVLRRVEGEETVGMDEVSAVGSIVVDYVEAEYLTVIPQVDLEAVVDYCVALMKRSNFFAPFAACVHIPDGVYVTFFLLDVSELWSLVIRKSSDDIEMYVHSGMVQETLGTVINVLGNFSLKPEDVLCVDLVANEETLKEEALSASFIREEGAQTLAEVMVDFIEGLQKQFGVEVEAYWNTPLLLYVPWDRKCQFWHEAIDRLNYVKVGRVVILVSTFIFVVTGGYLYQRIEAQKKTLSKLRAQVSVYEDAVKKAEVKFRAGVGYMGRAYVLGRQPSFIFLKEIPVDDGGCYSFNGYKVECDATKKWGWACSIVMEYDTKGCLPVNALKEIRERLKESFRVLRLISVTYKPLGRVVGQGKVIARAVYELR